MISRFSASFTSSKCAEAEARLCESFISAALIRATLSGEIAAVRRAPRQAMDKKTRFILVTTMTSMMVAMVTLIATLLNLGLHPGFLLQWAKAYIVGWPVAAATGYLIMPTARRFSDWVTTHTGGGA
jgi:hypothetical protein